MISIAPCLINNYQGILDNNKNVFLQDTMVIIIRGFRPNFDTPWGRSSDSTAAFSVVSFCFNQAPTKYYVTIFLRSSHEFRLACNTASGRHLILDLDDASTRPSTTINRTLRILENQIYNLNHPSDLFGIREAGVFHCLFGTSMRLYRRDACSEVSSLAPLFPIVLPIPYRDPIWHSGGISNSHSESTQLLG